MALNTGDTVMIEALYCKFLLTLYVTRKKHYVKIVLSKIETLYHKIGHCCLQLVRIKRMLPLHCRVDKQGIPMANWSLDGIIELVQKYYHRTKFRMGKAYTACDAYQ